MLIFKSSYWFLSFNISANHSKENLKTSPKMIIFNLKKMSINKKKKKKKVIIFKYL